MTPTRSALVSRVKANAAIAARNHARARVVPRCTSRRPHAITTHSVDIERLSVVIIAFHSRTPGASAMPRIPSRPTHFAAALRTRPATVSARNDHAPNATSVCTSTIARRLRAHILARSRNPNAPGPARKRRLHKGARAALRYRIESGP
jgi:hypothetical protein